MKKIVMKIIFKYFIKNPKGTNSYYLNHNIIIVEYGNIRFLKK